MALLGVALAAISAPGLGNAQPWSASTTRPVFPSGIDLVTVDAVVLDRQGRPVPGLTPADFIVTEDGRPQTISAFEGVVLTDPSSIAPARGRVSTNDARLASAGRWFVVVFDDANLTHGATARAREAVVGVFDRALRPGDHVLIAATSGGPWWTGRLPEDRDSLTRFVARLEGNWRPDTTAARLWDHEAMAIARGRDAQALAQVARRYFEGNVIPEAYPMDPEVSRAVDVSPGLALIQAKAREVYDDAKVRMRATLGSLDRVAAAVAALRGRKTVLLVSEGFILDPSQSEFRTLIRSARNANAAVHFVDVRAPEGMLGQAGMAGGGAEFGAAISDQDTTTALAFAALEAEGARSVAAETGGRTVSGTMLVEQVSKIIAEERTFYLLGYTPTNTARDGTFRTIAVSVTRPGVDVRARGGYYAPSDDPAPMRPDTLDPAVRAALDAPFGVAGIPLRLTSFVFGQNAEGKVQTLLLAEADVASLVRRSRGETFTAALDSYMVVYAQDGGETTRREKRLELDMPAAVFEQARRTGIPISHELVLIPGRYQARLLVRDRASGLLGSVHHEFVVPAAGGLRLSTPLLTDTLQPGAAGRPARPVPIARRGFKGGSRLFCAFDLYGAALDASRGTPRASVGYRLRAADGTELAAAPPRPLTPGPRGELTVLIAVTLPADAEGDHELQLIVRDEVSARTVDQVEPFVITR
jgi:VWFA-related protein